MRGEINPSESTKRIKDIIIPIKDFVIIVILITIRALFSFFNLVSLAI